MNSNLHYTSPKLSVKDSFDDDEVSDDVEDEVFIRDGKNGFKLDDEVGVKRPLMAPRRKFKYNQLNPERCKRPIHRRICLPYSYGVSFTAVFLVITIIIIILLCLFPYPMDRFRHWKMDQLKPPIIVPSTHFKSEYIWHQSFPFFKTESAIETLDANGDNIYDVIVGFSTGIQESEMPGKCAIHEGSNGECGGGVIALDGKDGHVLWKYWTRRDVLFLDCSKNVNADKTPDCLVSGKGGVLCILDGKTGLLIWKFSKSTPQHLLDLYSAQYIFDLNGDSYADVLISHTSDQSSHLVVLNGQNGEEIGQIPTPNKKSIFTVPRVIHTKNNSYNVVFATGSIETSGSLYIIPLDSIALSDLSKCVNIWRGPLGVISGILLADMNNDQEQDIIFTSGRVVAVINGKDNSHLWNVTSKDQHAQILFGPTPGYFDDDLIPDLLISELVGPSFPTYFYSKSWVVSGADGKALLDEAILGTGEMAAPGIALSFSGIGNDMFLYWSASCSVADNIQKQSFAFSQDTTLHEKTHADLCRLRFNTTIETQLYLLSQHIEPPGVLIYSSKNQWGIEHNTSDDSIFYHKAIENKYVSEKAASNFRHKDTNNLYPFSSESGQKKSSFGNYPVYNDINTHRSRWQPPEISYEDRISMLPSVNFRELSEPYYPQEASNPDVSGPVDDGRDERANYGKEMKKRHTVQPQPLPLVLPRTRSTAALVNSLNGTEVDIVFATYWETPSLNVRIFNEKEQKCIRKKLNEERSSNSLNSLELEMAEVSAERECNEGSDRLETNADTGGSGGQMTVFRVRISRSCTELRPGEVCSTLLPIEQQSFPRRGSDIIFKSRPQSYQYFLTA